MSRYCTSAGAIKGYLNVAFSSTGSSYFSGNLIEFQVWDLRVGSIWSPPSRGYSCK